MAAKLHPHDKRKVASQDYQHGIFQSIGFKEFHEFLITEGQCPEEKSQQLLEKGIEALKIVTKRYARKQNKWVRNRFLRLDGLLFHSCLLLFSLCLCTMSPLLPQGQTPPAEPIMVALDPLEEDKRSCHPCEVCQKVIIGDREWKAHLKSKSHRFQLKKLRQQAPDRPASTESPGATLDTGGNWQEEGEAEAGAAGLA
ncbi:hypothetical protein JD844_005149 [Phrynosoma platyrhinos]|uniref:Zinc finger double-stranded RNA binding domain-containing protein n=1 Tax=Phrynosoma platyrhinos TaxID=52577 RepID=A0ABQ7TMM6_PHRPL|nr:hypothetical protein JD844_005149 [Phrynosoma platyrhinos]